MTSILSKNYISDDTKKKYQMIDVNVYQENIFHTKMILNEYNLNNYLFGVGVDELSSGEQDAINENLQKEMMEIYYGRNMN